MDCKIVFVRGADGAMHRFALLDANEKVAFVCKEDVFEAIVSGHREAPGIGFPLTDVYVGTGDDLRPFEYAEA